ncbi:MAG: ABC transporter ATP-binding protein [Bacillota bacterium]|nr:ABC transporter ATP-binding protein [Bacillota bacterium]
MFKLVKYLKKYKKHFILGPIFKLIDAIFELIVPLVMARLIDVGLNPASPDRGYVFKMGGVLVLLGAVGLGFSYTCQFYASRASQGFGTELRTEMFRKISSLSHSELDLIGTPSLITRITNDVNQLQLAVAMFIRLVLRAPFLVIGSVIMAMVINLKLSIIFLIATPLISLVIYLVMSYSIPFYKIIQKKLDKISLITSENLEGTRVIRAFSGRENQEKLFESACEDHTHTAIKAGIISALLNPFNYIILNLAIVAILWFGGKLVNVGSMTTGQVIAFVNYITQIQLALVVVANLVIIFTKSSASAARINEVLNMSEGLYEGSCSSTDSQEENIISIKNVDFSYNDNVNNLDNISFDIRRGETVGIIGGTGSGKSTLINLLPRFYDVANGEIIFEGKNVRDYTFNALRSSFGIVPQHAVLFSGSIEENLRWNKSDATDGEIRRALEISQAAEFVDKLPEGTRHIIDEGGKNLSGGQKQRLTIARALVGAPKVLVFDDSSSALDYVTESKLRAALKTLDSTIIIVSQRAASIMHANKIIVMDEGKIAGIGTHAQLLDTCEVYKEICLSQQIEKEAV